MTPGSWGDGQDSWHDSPPVPTHYTLFSLSPFSLHLLSFPPVYIPSFSYTPLSPLFYAVV